MKHLLEYHLRWNKNKVNELLSLKSWGIMTMMLQYGEAWNVHGSYTFCFQGFSTEAIFK